MLVFLILSAITIFRMAYTYPANFSDTFLPPLEDWEVGDRWGCACWSALEPYMESDCRCSGDRLLDIPRNLSSTVRRLTVAEAAMVSLRTDALQPFSASLTDFSMTDVWRLSEIQVGVFKNLTLLQTIYIHRAPLLLYIHPDLFAVELKSLKFLRIIHTGLTSIPVLAGLRTLAPLHMVDFDYNHIRHVKSREVQLKTEQLLLDYNELEWIESRAFDKSQIAKLTLKGNKKLFWLHEDSFQGLESLRYLDLSETSIRELPTTGLQELEVLRLQQTPMLKIFPSVYNFKYISEVYLTYPYHCCAFHFPATHHPEEYAKHQKFLGEMSKNCSLELRKEESKLWNHPGQHRSGYLDHLGMFHDGVTVGPSRLDALCGNLSKDYGVVHCYPAPDAFNPCEDLMGNWPLRVSVWIVAVAAILGNAAVLAVLASGRFRMTVPKFLMCHLAVADLCMGLYLLSIAIMDVRSIGDYFNHAIDWQNGLGCQVAGALTVFARELSIFTLTVITVERWHTITFAMHLDRRLSLSWSCRLMVLGWLYAITMAACPLLGISSYTKTSICLPLESFAKVDIVYLSILLIVNGLAFCVVCGCYGRMYCIVRQGGTANALYRSDMTVAKRMALLVFTDFACWAPVAFFGVTALAGYPLIGVSHAKILLVFFYPLNSCANPYLYALLTRQYRRDLLLLLARYGLCSAAPVVRQKGTLQPHRPQCVSGPENPPTSQHRASILTTFTTVDPPVSLRFKPQIDIIPLGTVTSNSLNSKRHSNPSGYL